MNHLYLNILAEQWLEEKKQRMNNLRKIALPDEALYREIMLSLGYQKNKVQFLELAFLLPYCEIQKLETQPFIEKALLYRAGFIQDTIGLPADVDTSLKLDKSYWIFQSIRPVNFPDKRIEGISYLLSETIDKGIYNYFKEQIEKNIVVELDKSSAKKSVEKIMSFQGVGISKKREMFFNIIFPFFLSDETFSAYHNFLVRIFEIHPPLEQNAKIKKFYQIYTSTHHSEEITISNTKEYFGAIKYVNKYNLL
jgi:hypothetical protein